MFELNYIYIYSFSRVLFCSKLIDFTVVFAIYRYTIDCFRRSAELIFSLHAPQCALFYICRFDSNVLQSYYDIKLFDEFKLLEHITHIERRKYAHTLVQHESSWHNGYLRVYFFKWVKNMKISFFQNFW